MPNVPARVATRIAAGLKKYQPVIANARTRDVGEADTVTIIKDLLGEIFGYDKYTEITSEHAIRGTYCDLAINLDGDIAALIEVKSINTDLKDQNVKQAVDYATNQGVDWVVLTNGAIWKVFKITFAKPIDKELVAEFDLSQLEPKSDKAAECLFLICKEGWAKSALDDYSDQKQALSRFFLAAVVLSDKVVGVIRRELRRLSPDVPIDPAEIVNALQNEVIKRDCLEGDKAETAKRKIARAAAKQLRESKKDDDDDSASETGEEKSAAAAE